MSSVDVIVPCYNYGRFLRECVDSVLTQDGVSVRVLIIDDCSSDDSEQVGRAIAAGDARVEFRRHEKNQGHIATYNEGLEWIAGDYCLLLSADDLITPGSLLRASRLMNENSGVGMTYGAVLRTTDPAVWNAEAPARYEVDVIDGNAFIERACRTGTTSVETATAVVRTSIQRAIGGYRKELPHSGDQEMWLRCASLSSIGRIRLAQGIYRQHGMNMSCDYYVGRRDFDQVKQAFEFFFNGFGASLAGRKTFRDLLDRNLSVQAFHLANDAFEAGSAESCAELLREATALCPGIRAHPGWRKLRVKRLIGIRLSSVLNRALRLARTTKSSATAATPSPR